MCAECGCHGGTAVEEQGGPRNHIELAGSARPAIGEMTVVVSDGVKVAVANVDGALYAFDATCTHQGCSLGDGELEGATVVCPCHEGTFDIATGAVLSGPPPAPIRTYGVHLI